MVFSDENRIWIKRSLHLKGYTAKRLTDKFPEESWTKRAVNKLLKLRDTGTVDRRQSAADRAVPALKKTLRQLMI